MFKFRSLTNVRPTKDLGSQVICAPTEGQFKVTPEAAKAIGVSDGDYLQIVKDDATGIAYAVKGDAEEGVGGKLASSNKGGGGMLTFSAAAAWQELDGDTDSNTHFDVDTEGAIEDEGKTYFPLTFAEKVEKQVRKRKDGSDLEEGEEEEVEEEVSSSDFDDM